jgi:murein L,D-transpeptidase YcbB/YkuD
MSKITDTMKNLADEAEIAAQTDDYTLEEEISLLTRMNRTLLESHSTSTSKLVEYIDAFKAQKEEFHKLADAYKELQKEHDQTPELVFMSLSLDPAGTLQDFLKHMERQAKIEDQSGEAWKWKFQLTFWHRAKIAIKLLMGPVRDCKR